MDIEKYMEKFTEEVDTEGCQAVHSNTECTHCQKDPCPHCQRWGGQQRTEKRFRINEADFRTTLTAAIDQACKEERERIVEWVNKNMEDFYPDEHGISGEFVDAASLITHLTK